MGTRIIRPTSASRARFVPRRLDKYVRDSTPFGVAAVREAVGAGRVHIDGRTARGDELVFEGDAVCLDGRRVEPRLEQHHAVLHKPLGVTSTVRDPLGQRDLRHWLREMPGGMFPVGRLDRETSGLLLFTTDGDFATAVLRPEHETPKKYWLWLEESVSADDARLRQLVDGVPTSSGLASAVDVELVQQTESYTELVVTLTEGKNRQIRKMCFEVGLRLRALHRKSIGSLTLEGLESGRWRRLTRSEVDELYEQLGGRALIRARKVAALERMAASARAEGAAIERLEAWLSEEDTHQ